MRNAIPILSGTVADIGTSTGRLMLAVWAAGGRLAGFNPHLAGEGSSGVKATSPGAKLAEHPVKLMSVGPCVRTFSG